MSQENENENENEIITDTEEEYQNSVESIVEDTISEQIVTQPDRLNDFKAGWDAAILSIGKENRNYKMPTSKKDALEAQWLERLSTELKKR